MKAEGEHARHVAICVATRWEFAPVVASLRQEGMTLGRAPGGVGRHVTGLSGQLRVTVLQMGIGPTQAARVTRRFLERNPCDLLLSTGFAAGLTDMRIGDLLIAKDTIGWPQEAAASIIPSDPDWIAAAEAAARESGVASFLGRMVSVGRVVTTAQEKQYLAIESGGIGLDMESQAIATLACEHHCAFLVVRAVSDLVTEDLPLDFNRFLQGSTALLGLRDCLRPAALRGLWRLRRQTSCAAAHLTRFFHHFLPMVLGCRQGHLGTP